MFLAARPVWGKQEMNQSLLFCSVAPKGSKLRIAAADFYKVYLNGETVGFGPARAAKGYARVDEYAVEGEVRIEVVGYGCRSLSTVQQPSFCCAEIVCNDTVVAATGVNFDVFLNRERRQKVERYSAQRHFTEVYDIGLTPESVNLQEVAAPLFMERRAPYAVMDLHNGMMFVRGTFTQGGMRRTNSYTTNLIAEKGWGVFAQEEILDKPFRFADSQIFTKTGEADLPVVLNEGEWIMMDVGVIEAGFPYIKAVAVTDATVIMAMSEYCGDTFSFVERMECQPVIQYNIPAGQILDREAFDVSSFQKVAVLVTKGQVELQTLGWRDFIRDMSRSKQLTFSDPALQKIYNAAIRSFSHNAVDIFTDCPSRERGAWLCDSFFSGRAEHFFMGNSEVESTFLENYMLYQNQGEFPAGALPMVYPSDPEEKGTFIPQWNLWYVLEVCEYLTERSAVFSVEDFLPSVNGVLCFFEQYENELGLLENLPSWNFVEWSDANAWTQDVNYPTNFLYAEVLDAVADAFDLDLHDKAQKIRETTKRLAWNGEVFVDHARREEGGLVNCEHVSEAGQYYAALFGKVDWAKSSYAGLKQHIEDGFVRYHKPICRINAFIGMYLRIWVLAKMGDKDLMHKSIKDNFGVMSEKTGTLWEHKTSTNSLDHGFASYVATVM